VPTSSPTIVLAGLPGKMATEVALAVAQSGDLRMADVALVAPEHSADSVSAAGRAFKAVRPADRAAAQFAVGAIAVDFTWPDSALANVEFYASRGIPFVMGTTGFDSERARAIVAASGVSAVMAPNMAVPIVLLQTAVARVAADFADAMAGYDIRIVESHQKTKLDTSGTAKALVRDFARLGLSAAVDDIQMVRDPRVQLEDLEVPEEFLDGHAYHYYEISSEDGHARVALSHCIEGRRVYADGALLAVRFLAARIAEGSRGVVYSMTDVLADSKRK